MKEYKHRTFRMLFSKSGIIFSLDLLGEIKVIQKYNLGRVAAILGATFLFLFALNFTGHAFKLAGGDIARSILSATYNPFIGLFIGLLATAIIQSSSTTTSLIVAAVAAGSLELSTAVPMVMGANIGTTLTSTLVSIGYLNRKKEFRKAIAAGTLHDVFNILVTLILFPLEVYYGFLSELATWLTNFISPLNSGNPEEGFSYGFRGDALFSDWLFSRPEYSIVMLIASFVVLVISIKLLSHLLYDALIGKVKDNLQRLIFSNPLRSFLWGTGLTAIVQSSSVTTPLVVPLVATGKLSLKKAFPYIMGANIGTTITAILAALSHSNEAISIAVVHILFNLLGVLIFFPLSFLRRLPIRLASLLGKATIKNRLFGFIYIIITFFLLPFLLIYFNQNIEEPAEKEVTLPKPAPAAEQELYP